MDVLRIITYESGKIEAGNYLAADGRRIIKDGSNWYIIKVDGNIDFGPAPTLTTAKEYVSTGSIGLTKHNLDSKHGRKQSKKEFITF